MQNTQNSSWHATRLTHTLHACIHTHTHVQHSKLILMFHAYTQHTCETPTHAHTETKQRHTPVMIHFLDAMVACAAVMRMVRFVRLRRTRKKWAKDGQRCTPCTVSSPLLVDSQLLHVANNHPPSPAKKVLLSLRTYHIKRHMFVIPPISLPTRPPSLAKKLLCHYAHII